MSFALYTIGYIIFLGGVAWGMTKAGVSPVWIAITCMILLGLGIATGVTRTRSKDPSS